MSRFCNRRLLIIYQVKSQVASDVLLLEEKFRIARHRAAVDLQKSRQEHLTQLSDSLPNPKKNAILLERAPRKWKLEVSDGGQEAEPRANGAKGDGSKRNKLPVGIQTKIKNPKTKAHRKSANAAEKKQKDSTTNKLPGEIQTTNNDPESMTPKLSAKATKTKKDETSSLLSVERDLIVKPEQTRQGQTNEQPCLATAGTVRKPKIKIRTLISRPKIKIRTLISRSKIIRNVPCTSVGLAESRDNVPAKVRIQKASVKQLAGVKAVVRRRRLLSSGVAVDKVQDVVPAKVRTQEAPVKKVSSLMTAVQRRRREGVGKVSLPKVKGSANDDANEFDISRLNIQTVKAEQLHFTRRSCCPGIGSRL